MIRVSHSPAAIVSSAVAAAPAAGAIGALVFFVGCRFELPGPEELGHCGDGLVNGDEGEECDDSNTSDGDGCSATCTAELTPRLTVGVDRSSIATELRTTHLVTVTLAGAGGFGGDVTLSGAVVDTNNSAIPGWMVAFNTT